MRGLFVVFEGGEGVGKTTQWSRLAQLLSDSGFQVTALREPGGTVLGDRVRQIVLDPDSHLSAEAELLLFSASRAQLVTDVIFPALERGQLVLVDRFLLSTYAYQGAGRGLSDETVRQVSRTATQGLVPDLTLLLTMPMEDAFSRAMARGAADRMEREGREFHRRVAAAFDEASSVTWQQAHPELGPIERVDASGTEETVQHRLLSILSSRWPERFGGLLPSGTIQSPISEPINASHD